jgi:hypothetical protein
VWKEGWMKAGGFEEVVRQSDPRTRGMEGTTEEVTCVRIERTVEEREGEARFLEI